MASIRKRSWESVGGEIKTRWVADYFDQLGKRHLKTFPTKKAADAWLVSARHEVAAGTHTPENTSVSVADAGKLWLETCEANGLERATLSHYRTNLALHILPYLGREKLAHLTTPRIVAYRNQLLLSERDGRRMTRVSAMKVLTSLKGLLADAQQRGLVAQNVASSVRIKSDRERRDKVEIGIDVPTEDEVRRIIEHAKPVFRPLLLTAIFTGMRASELRGLPWSNVDFAKNIITVKVRADRFNMMGATKSGRSRKIPLAPHVRNSLLAWQPICPKGHHNLVFPTRNGNIQCLGNIWTQFYAPAQIAAGVIDANGKAKYGMHALRHFFASWAIKQGFKPKHVQMLLGHADIGLTMNTYVSLFPSEEDDAEQFALGALQLLGPTSAPALPAKPLRAVV